MIDGSSSSSHNKQNEQNKQEWRGIWVIAEQMGGVLSTVSFELLGKAQELQTKASDGEPVTAVLLGEDGAALEEMAAQLAGYGAQRVIVAAAPELKLYQPETYALVLADMIAAYRPSIVLIGATGTGSHLAPAVGAKLKTGVAAHCVDARLNAEGELVAVVPAFGGRVLGDILCPRHRPQIASFKPGVLVKPPYRQGAEAVTVRYDPGPSLQRDPGRVKAIGLSREEPEGLPLEEAEVVIAGGWGMGSRENWRLLEELAGLLGGAVGCTRPAVDEGWAGEHQMIGTSGKTVRPKVYLGAGISGATHHICGMKDAGLIISINKDEKAPIFQLSDIAVVGDAGDILAGLIAAIKQGGVV